MGNYNPFIPQIVGQEWVAIRDDSLILNPFANTLERGYTFVLPTATRINNVRFYMKEWNPTFGSSMIFTASVYPAGQEASSGPVRSVVIPSGAVVVTGSGSRIFPTPTGTDPASALYASGDNLFLYWIMGQGATAPIGMSIFFSPNAFAQLLNGKRILGVDLLLGINMVSQGFEIEDIFQSIQVHVTNDFNYDPVNRTDTWRLSDLITNRTPESTQQIVRLHLGDANRFFGVSNLTTAGVHNINQWTYPQLQRFEASASNRLQILLTEGASIAAVLGPEVQIEYAALEVFYCEESRVLAGSRIFNDDIPNRPLRDPLTLGMNAITVRNPTTLDENFNLPAGVYTVTISESNMGDNYYAAIYRSVAQLNEVRQLYSLPTMPGVQVNIPFPLNDDIINTTMTKESTAFIPQLTMHLSGGALVEYSHVYGQQSVGQVYGTQVVQQDIDDRFVGSVKQYPYVRFYARRFGSTAQALKLSSPSISGSAGAVQITPAEWDALPELVDGWKEITLQFTSAPSFGAGTNTSWQWSALGEAAANRWEVLGATAPAVSGIAFQPSFTPWFNQVPSGQQLYLGTYGYPTSGAAVNEDWLPQWGPYVSGSAPDQASDATIIFSQYMPTVTGFSVSVASQALTGIGLQCGIAPCGVPTSLLYNQLTWGFPVNTGYGTDAFNRTVSNGLGSADVGGAYTLSQAATNYNVTAPLAAPASGGNAAIMNSPPAGLGNLTIGTLSNIGPDFDITLTAYANGGITGSSARGSAIGRFTDANNYYEGLLQTTTTTGISIVGISRTVGGAGTVIQTINITQNINNSTRTKLRFMGQGPFLKIKAWSEFTDEPDTWHIELTDTNLTSGSGAGFAVRTLDTRDTVAIDDFTVTPPRYWFGYYELQRSDAITDWQTIMKATSPAVTGFKDYEARTDTLSSYRIRAVNNYEFAGQWSSTASVFLLSPGVSGGCFSNGEHVMMFTSNERQNGSINLAYSNAWENEVTEDFNFAEASFTQLQPMFERDFFTAFRPLERGGDQFSRNLLINAAAISPPTLPGFTSLSDMAWADVPYICVRDEDGNRWFATVNVPAGTVQNKRKLYLATINIVEVTTTPSPVDP